jgi:hypothetical protein
VRAKEVLYLFDTNVLITASNMYYPLDGVPEFWEWIDHQATNERINFPSKSWMRSSPEARRTARSWTG